MSKFIKPIFTEEGHRYDSSLGRYTSVTTRIHAYEPEKDWIGIAKMYLAKRTAEDVIKDLMQKQHKSRLEVVNMIGGRPINVETMQSIWKQYSAERCEFGSKEHAYREGKDLSTAIHKISEELSLPVGINPKPVVDYYKDLPDGVYPELLLWDNETMTSGTADRVIIQTVNGVRYVYIEDYKTNKELRDYNYLDKRGNPVINEYMLPPFDRFCNCNYWHYQIQLNMYGYMLSKFGFVVKGGTIIHTTDNDKRIILKNLQPYVAKAFEQWKV